MEDKKAALRTALLEGGAVKFDNFVLTSGKTSNYYVDIKDLATDPGVLSLIGSLFAGLIREKSIAGVELGAVPLLVATSIASGARYVIIRKERKHGTGKLNIGGIAYGEKFEVIEDVVTTGGSIMKAVSFIRESGGRVERAYCVVDREEGGSEFLFQNGVKLTPIFRISDMRD